MNDALNCMKKHTSNHNEPLVGIRVLDLSRFVAGPLCAQILGDMGAEVIKIETLKGDPGREIAPIISGESLYFNMYNRSKKGITLNLRTHRGLVIFRELILKSDILIDNFRPGVLDKIGLSPKTIENNYKYLIHATILGFGREGPYANLQCFDEIAVAMGGLMNLIGSPNGPPTLPGVYIADYFSGMYLALGILLALRHREKTGLGQKVDVALLNSIFSITHSALPEYYLLNNVMERSGNLNRGIAPGNAYKARDGYIVIEAITQGMWENLARIMGREDLLNDPRFGTPSDRRKHVADLDPIVARWVRKHSVQEVFDTLKQNEVACGPVNDIARLANDPQIEANKQIEWVQHPTLGPLPLPNIVVKLGATPGSIKGPAPTLGQHNEEVYGNLLGYSRGGIAQLREEHVI
jgi:CoA:oxalate CoA-transferase